MLLRRISLERQGLRRRRMPLARDDDERVAQHDHRVDMRRQILEMRDRDVDRAAVELLGDSDAGRQKAQRRAGSNPAPRLSAASICSIAVATKGAISRARAVGSILVAVRTNRSSAKRLLRRDRAWLIAGCDNPILPAARVTARSFISASNAFSKLRSTARISIGRMHIILSN